MASIIYGFRSLRGLKWGAPGMGRDPMGIGSRDYMKRRPDDDGDGRSSADNKMEAALSGFLRRHPRFLIYVLIAIGALVVIAVVVAALQ